MKEIHAIHEPSERPRLVPGVFPEVDKLIKERNNATVEVTTCESKR
jgi:hypothetical protein